MRIFLCIILFVFLCIFGALSLRYPIIKFMHRDLFPTYPTFDPKIKWDISKKDSKVARAFSIVREIPHTFAFIISFRITDSEKDLTKLRPQLTEKFGRGRVAIPIRIKVEMLDVNRIGQEATVLDETVTSLAHRSAGAREVDRIIASLRMAPGRYLVTVTTVEDTSLPDWIETYFSIGLPGSSK